MDTQPQQQSLLSRIFGTVDMGGAEPDRPMSMRALEPTPSRHPAKLQPTPKEVFDAAPTPRRRPGTGARGRGTLTAPIARRAPTPPARHPAAMHATAFLNWLSESLFDLEAIASTYGKTFSPSDAREIGIHRYWEDKESGSLFAEILHSDVQDGYLEMCGDHNWIPHRWNQIATELREHLGGKKTYTRVLDDDGIERKLRVYRIPVPDKFRNERIAQEMDLGLTRQRLAEAA